MRNVQVKVQVTDFEPTAMERAIAIRDYDPTEAMPEPDEEWIHEYSVMARIENALPKYRTYVQVEDFEG